MEASLILLIGVAVVRRRYSKICSCRLLHYLSSPFIDLPCAICRHQALNLDSFVELVEIVSAFAILLFLYIVCCLSK